MLRKNHASSILLQTEPHARPSEMYVIGDCSHSTFKAGKEKEIIYLIMHHRLILRRVLLSCMLERLGYALSYSNVLYAKPCVDTAKQA